MTCHLDYEGDTGGFGDGTDFPIEGEMDVGGEMDVEGELDVEVELDLDDEMDLDEEMEPDDGVVTEPLDSDEMNTQRVLRRIEDEELVVEEFPTSSNCKSPK
jgi:hypothetical protein